MENHLADFNCKINEILNTAGISTDIADDKNLIELGISSIQLMKIASRLRKSGFKVTFADLISQPTFGQWKTFLMDHQKEDTEKKNQQPEEVHDMHQPFPLTDVQNAYWIGRMGGLDIGNVGCHGYMEVDTERVDVERLNKAFYELQMHHPMLRVKITTDGRQYISDHPYTDTITVYDYRNGNAEAHLQDVRSRCSHRLLDIYNGQVIALQVTLLPEEKARIHFDMDLLIADVTSFQIILRDLVRIYNGRILSKAGHDFNFADYIYAEQKADAVQLEADKKYWTERLASLPGKPELPIKNTNVAAPVFERRRTFLEAEKWEKFKNICAGYKVTPATVLLTIYGKVIARFSENSKFLINIPLFNRSGDMAGLEDAVADFTTLLLMEFDFSRPESFWQEIQRVNQEFRGGMQHIRYSGVSVERDYMKLHPEEKIVAPVVFSCNLGIPLIDEEFRETFGDIAYMISQTPQVWLDFQLFDNENGLLMIWDSVEGIFVDSILDDMFAAFERTLRVVADQEDWGKEITVDIHEQLQVRKSYEIFEEPEEKTGIHEKFFKFAEAHPDATALIDSEDQAEVSYGELRDMALRMAQALVQQGIRPEDHVGICLKRGKYEIAAALGILAAGAAYVTIGYHQPLKRREYICRLGKIQWIITDQKEQNNMPEGIRTILDQEALREEPLKTYRKIDESAIAYIIFTSGSTGVPKGVMISHEAAVNTIDDINEKYHVGPEDTALQVSAMDFDLSVYDIFGLLSVGGKLVLIPEGKQIDAKELLDRCLKYDVTLYNSVPALLDLLLIEAEARGKKLPALRLALISGDWIPLELPPRFYERTEQAQFIALGGATEGSIWSNFYPVDLVIPESFTSIPYGHPLKNQKYRVVNDRNEDCPDYVSGELWIGGKGVASGYAENEVETQAHFVRYANERWYKTGDYGRFWKDGTIEFLGRRDHQIKIRGHRIEIEEIEKGYLKNEKVSRAVVLPVGETKAEYMAAFLVPKKTVTETSLLTHQSCWKKWEKISENKKTDENAIQKLTTCYLAALLGRMGIRMEKGVSFQKSDLSLAENYTALFDRWMEFLAGRQILEQKTEDEIQILRPLNLDEKAVSMPEYQAFADKIAEKLPEILTGKTNAVQAIYGRDDFDLQTFIESQPGAKEKYTMLIQAADEYIQNESQIENILIIGAREQRYIQKFLDELFDRNLHITIMDVSSVFLNEMMEKNNRDDISFEKCSEAELVENSMDRRYDLILSFDYLHQFKNLNKVLKRVKNMLSPRGLFLFSEVTENSAIEWITTAVLEEGFRNLEDARKESHKPLMAADEWKGLMEELGYAPVEIFMPARNIEEQTLFAAQNPECLYELNQMEMDVHIRQNVPDYMVPKQTMILTEFPCTANGKIDRKRLLEYTKQYQEQNVRTLPETEFEKRAAAIWKEILKVEEVYMEDDFYLLGGDSLIATRMKNAFRKEYEIDVTLETFFQNPVFSDFVEKLKIQDQKAVQKEQFGEIKIDPASKYEAFPLTDVQNAYWIGTHGGYDLGDVSSHCYFEMDSEAVDSEAMQKSLNELIRAHDMMRAVILPDGSGQRILKDVDVYNIPLARCTEDIEVYVQEIRHEMESRVYDSSVWPLFEIRLTYYQDRMRIHTSFDNIIFDGFSIFHLFEQWKALQQGKEIAVSRELSYRDYVLKQEEIKTSRKYAEDLEYWQDKIKDMFMAPQLPRTNEAHNGGFERFEMKLQKTEWETIRRIAEKYHVTMPVFFIAAYSEVLSRYTNSKQFTLNLTRFQKLPFHEDVDKLIGDFTTLTLLEIDLKDTHSFIERCQKIQKQLYQDLEHSLVSGVEVERRLSQQLGKSGITMPIVFTSGFGINQSEGENIYFGEIVYGRSQTPQVWLDQQISIQNGKMFISWDSVVDMFPEHFIENMFASYQELLTGLTEKVCTKASANLVQLSEIEAIEKRNNMLGTYKSRNMVEAFRESAEKYPDHIAIWSTKRVITYAELDQITDRAARALAASGVQKEDPVAVMMEKGPMQIAAAVSILKAGAYYLPIDIHNPEVRIRNIIEKADVQYAVSDTELQLDASLTQNMRLFTWDSLEAMHVEQELPEIDNAQTAYIIFTSGSTGVPKGVVISHEAAMNTIIDINEKYKVTGQDGTIMLSNLNFDLSVYDIFGMLSAGGHIVVPDYDQVKDPEHWGQIIRAGKVTVWNSVPTFMQMMVEYQNGEQNFEHTVRLVLLSGDWIPVNLPQKVYDVFGPIQMVGLGGATEASIWSNYFDIPAVVPEKWESIPYGRPMKNQGFIILNDDGQRVPAGVTGELYIIGKGISKGYINNPEKNKTSFLTIPGIEGKVYRTGDYGRYLADGVIKFAGRKDNQIKKGGHRIELGEIESGLGSIDGVKQAIVTFVKGNDHSLTASIVLEHPEEQDVKNDRYIKAQLMKRVPEYMIPNQFIFYDAFPVSANGKVDRKALAAQAENIQPEEHFIEPATCTEKKIAAIWKELLDCEKISAENTFFELGGDSLKAIRFINMYGGKQVTLQMMTKYPMLSELATAIDENSQKTESEEDEFSEMEELI